MKDTPKKRSAQEEALLAEAKARLAKEGISISSWAMAHGIPPGVVTDLLSGRTKGSRGHTLKAAVLLGIKADPKAIRRAA